MKESEQSILVIGGGLMGSAAAWQLSAAGYSVLLIEQQAEKYKNGSSYGEARVTRSLGTRNDPFTYLKERSVEETRKLMDFLDLPMEKIYATSPVTYLYDQTSTEPSGLILDGDYIYAGNPEEAKQKLGMIVQNEIVIREFKPYSGTLNPTELIRCLHMGVKKKGGKILFEHTILSIVRNKGRYMVGIRNNKDLAEHNLEYDRIVVAAGPYNGNLLRSVAPYFHDLIQLKRLFLSFFKPEPNWFNSLSKSDEERLVSGFPVARFDEDIFYAMIENYDDDGIPLFKVGGHNRRFKLDQPSWNEPIPNEEIDWSHEQLDAYLKRLGFLDDPVLQCVNSYSCIYSMTSNEMPYVTPLLRYDHSTDNSCVVIAGLSGIGAKGSLCYGKIAADIISGTEDADAMYIVTRNALGEERLLYDLMEQGLM